MNVYLNKISGYASAINTMFISKRTWTRELERRLYALETECISDDGRLSPWFRDANYVEFVSYLEKLIKIGKKHITLLRFIDIEFTVEGIHRGAQDDFDAHAKRLDNRIVRASTRLSEFEQGEMSEWYKGKIRTLDDILTKEMGVTLPTEIKSADGTEWVKSVNGYIRRDLMNDKDVKRGLYTLSIPSTFTAKCNLTEFAHIVKLRDKNSNASPELKEMIESLLVQIRQKCPYFTREFFYLIEN